MGFVVIDLVGLFVTADWEVRVRTGLGCGDGGCCEVVRELKVWVHGLVITVKARDLVFWEWAVARVGLVGFYGDRRREGTVEVR